MSFPYFLSMRYCSTWQISRVDGCGLLSVPGHNEQGCCAVFLFALFAFVWYRIMDWCFGDSSLLGIQHSSGVIDPSTGFLTSSASAMSV